jgi:glycosyltransferase involved in cell wall biosynthesis
MTRVSLVRLGSAAPMGQQTYESELLVALRQCLSDEWTIQERAVLPMRTARGAGRRLPLRLVWNVPYKLAAAVGTLAYGRADLIHRLDLRCPPWGRGREVLTVHDLPPLRFDDEGTIPHWAARSARASAAVICPSEFAAAEIRELLGVRRVYVVPYGIDPTRAEALPLSEAELVDLGLRRPLVLHAAGATARKNLKLLAAAWRDVASADPEALLALCGPPDARRDEAFSDVSNVVYIGHRPPTFVARLMRTAAVVVVPSTYEGFGLPALEGMAAGAAVVAAACGALPEVCADAALLVAPEREAFAGAILQALAGGSLVDRLRAAGRARAATFSWERAARDTVGVYQQALG